MTNPTFDPWADYDTTATQAAEKTSYKPIPAGPREFNLFEATIVPYTNKSKEESAYAGLYALKVQLKVPEGEEFGNRSLFPRIPLFPKSPPAGPHTKEPGAVYVQHDFFNFFGKSLGWDADKVKAFGGLIRSGDIAGAQKAVQTALGKRVRATVTVTPANEYNPDGGNEVKFWDAPKGSASVQPSAAAADAWAAATPAASPAPDAWSTSPKENPILAEAVALSQGF